MFPEKKAISGQMEKPKCFQKKGNFWSNGETAMFADKQFSAQDFPAAKHFAWKHL